MTTCLFIFRRDYRIIDNNGLNYAMNKFDKVIPIFIFTPEQTKNNKYFSDNCFQFLIESLKELDKELKKNKSKLHIFQGDNVLVLKKIIKKIDVTDIVYNMDYTPYARKRDKQIQKFCKKEKINCHEIEDYLISKIGELNKKDGNPYTVFTPFRNNGLKYKVEKPKSKKIKNLKKVNLTEQGFLKYEKNDNILYNGGRKNGLKMLNKLKNHIKYDDNRNTLSLTTTHLSAYIKFGCISIREAYWKIRDLFGSKHGLLSQLFWREFYYYITYYFPHTLQGKNYNSKYDKIKWETSKTNFKKWCEGKTGFPVVDAGMIEMNTTGYMHNRSRLITANFLNRMLGYHWTVGEKYYAQTLFDYDPAVNNGNWQWIASTGTDPKPYFQRLFNPMLQSKKFDVEAEYIKKWLPQLKDIPAKELHNWADYCNNYDLKKINYVKPIINYKEARQRSVNMYRKVLK